MAFPSKRSISRASAAKGTQYQTSGPVIGPSTWNSTKRCSPKRTLRFPMQGKCTPTCGPSIDPFLRRQPEVGNGAVPQEQTYAWQNVAIERATPRDAGKPQPKSTRGGYFSVVFFRLRFPCNVRSRRTV